MRTNCDSICRSLSEALDNVLSPERQVMVDRHLADCHSCHARYAQLQRQQASLRGIPAVVPPAWLEDRVRQTWHPLLRSFPALKLYPYMPAVPAWGNVRQLRLAGHLAGFFVTAAGMLLILSLLGKFSLGYEQLTQPGVYSLMNRPSRIANRTMTAARGNLDYAGDTDMYVQTNVLAESARLNEYVLARFTNDEMGALHEDSLSVVTQVQPDGRGAIEGVLHTPRDRMLFVRFSQLLSTSQFTLPLSEPRSNGRIIWSFCRIIVIS